MEYSVTSGLSKLYTELFQQSAVSSLIGIGGSFLAVSPHMHIQESRLCSDGWIPPCKPSGSSA